MTKPNLTKIVGETKAIVKTTGIVIVIAWLVFIHVYAYIRFQGLNLRSPVVSEMLSPLATR